MCSQPLTDPPLDFFHLFNIPFQPVDSRLGNSLSSSEERWAITHLSLQSRLLLKQSYMQFILLTTTIHIGLLFDWVLTACSTSFCQEIKMNKIFWDGACAGGAPQCHSHMDRRVGHRVVLATPMLFAINMTYSSLRRHLFKEGARGCS